MRVCIIRNAQIDTNPDAVRIIDALSSDNIDALLLTRNRMSISKRYKIRKDNFNFQGKIIPNYELQLNSNTNSGYKNIGYLGLYMIYIFIWLFFNRNKFDVIHAFDLDAGLPSYLVALITRKQFVYHISDFFTDSRSGIPRVIKKNVRKLEYYIISKAEVTIICTDERREQIKGSKPRKLEVVHNSPVSDVTYEANNYNRENGFSIVYVGALSPNRFIMESIEIIAKFPEIEFIIAGYGTLEEKVKDASRRYDNINFLGRVSYEKALEIYSKSDVMLAMYNPEILNHKYAAPNKIYESMMLAKPIIVARDTSADKLVMKYQIGYVIDYSIQEFESLILKLLKSQNFKEIGENALKAYKDYSWNTMKNRLKEIYRYLN